MLCPLTHKTLSFCVFSESSCEDSRSLLIILRIRYFHYLSSKSHLSHLQKVLMCYVLYMYLCRREVSCTF